MTSGSKYLAGNSLEQQSHYSIAPNVQNSFIVTFWILKYWIFNSYDVTLY